MLLNDTVRLEDDKVRLPRRDRAVVIFGVAVEGARQYPRFSVVIDEYNVENNASTGNCWRYNRVQGTVPSNSAAARHFAFDVAPGYYIFSAFNGVKLSGDNTFFVPEGNIVYLGDFIHTADGSVVRRSNTVGVSALTQKFQNLEKEIVMAETRTGTPTAFLCSP